MFVVGGRELPPDKEVADIGGDLQRIAVSDDNVGGFSGFKRAYLVGKTQNLRRVEGYSSERFVVWQTVSNGASCVLAKAPRERVVETGDGEFHAGFREFGRLGEQAIVGIVFLTGQREHRPQDDWHALRAQQILNFVRFAAARDDDFQLLLVGVFHRVANFACLVGENKNR